MKTVNVEASLQHPTEKGPVRTMNVNFEVGETLEELVEQVGKEMVHTHAYRALIISLQGFMRSQMRTLKEEGKDDDEIQAAISETVKTWKPSQRKPGKSPIEKARDILTKLTPAERAAFLKEIRSRPAAASADAA